MTRRGRDYWSQSTPFHPELDFSHFAFECHTWSKNYTVINYLNKAEKVSRKDDEYCGIMTTLSTSVWHIGVRSNSFWTSWRNRPIWGNWNVQKLCWNEDFRSWRKYNFTKLRVGQLELLHIRENYSKNQNCHTSSDEDMKLSISGKNRTSLSHFMICLLFLHNFDKSDWELYSLVSDIRLFRHVRNIRREQLFPTAPTKIRNQFGRKWGQGNPYKQKENFWNSDTKIQSWKIDTFCLQN